MRLLPAVALALALTACGGSDSDDSAEDAAPTMKDAESCAPTEEGAKTVDYNLDDDSLAVTVDTAGVEGQLHGIGAVSCVVNRLDGPASIAERVAATTGMDGPQSESWDGFEANWSYSGSSDRLLFTVDAR